MAKMYKKQIYVANYIGEDEDGKPLYTDTIAIYAFVSSPDSNVTSYNIGLVKSYDRKVSLDIGTNTEFLNEQSRLWIDTVPNDSNAYRDYSIERISDIVNRTFNIYVNRESSNMTNLYYCNDETNIIQVKVAYDGSEKIAVIPKNMYFPIDADSLVWYKKPADATVTTYTLTYVSKELINNSYKITFE